MNYVMSTLWYPYKINYRSFDRDTWLEPPDPSLIPCCLLDLEEPYHKLEYCNGTLQYT